MIYELAAKILFLDGETVAVYYIAILFVLSVVCDVFPFPPTYFSTKGNILNVYFAKKGPFIAITVLVPAVAAFYLAYAKKRKFPLSTRVKIAALNAARVGAFLALSMAITLAVDDLGNVYGMCQFENRRRNTRELCESAGFIWSKLDVSGHTIILIYYPLSCMEEAKVLKCLDLGRDFLSMVVKFAAIIMAIFTLVCYVAVATTAVYFHTITEKVLGGVLGCSIWYVLYRLVLPRLPHFLVDTDVYEDDPKWEEGGAQRYGNECFFIPSHASPATVSSFISRERL